jgi:predicted Zn-dependent peptidase
VLQKASFALLVAAGSRYDVVPGSARLLAELAFGPTPTRSAAKLRADLDAVGGVAEALVDRDHVAWVGHALRGAPAAVALDAVLEAAASPLLLPWDVTTAADRLTARLASEAEHGGDTHRTAAAVEALYAAAFGRASPLGHPCAAPHPAHLAAAAEGGVLNHFLAARVLVGPHVTLAAKSESL